MMIKSYLALLFLFIFSASISVGQPGTSELTSDRTISFPSPTSASLGKFGFLPVNYSSGMVNVNVPLWEIKEDELSLPVKLIYNNNGLRVAEEASWVGHGWALAANYSITRIVRGLPDFEGSVILNNNNGKHFDQLGSPTFMDNLTANRIAKGLYDGEPDLFSFTCGEFSGKFLMFNNEAIPVPYNGLKVLREGDFFKIITDRGITYEFGKREITTLNDANGTPFSTLPFTSAWLLTKITSSNKFDEIDFIYSAQPEIVESASNQAVSFIFTGNAPPYNSNCGDQRKKIPLITKSTVSSWRLEMIQSANIEIRFIPQPSARLDLYGDSKALDQIEIRYRGNSSLIKKFKFSYGYFGSEVDKDISRLKLNSVLEYGSDGERLQPYQFEYNTYGFPSKTSFSMDHWGYANASGNQDLIPKVYEWQNYGTADRGPFTLSTQSGILTKIIYPTKGYTTFTYTQNQYLSGQELKDGPGVRIDRMVDFDGNKSRIVRFAYEAPVFFGEPKYGEEYKLNCNFCIPAGPTHCIDDVLWLNYAAVTGNNTSLFAGLSSFSLNYQKVTEYKGQNGEFGVTEFLYEPAGQYVIDREMRLKETILKSQGDVVKRTVNSYTNVQDRILHAFKPSLSSFNNYTAAFPNMFESDPIDGSILNDYNLDGDNVHYWITSTWSYLNKTTTSEFQSGFETISSETVYRHLATPIHRFLTDVEAKDSDGVLNTTKLVYVSDFNTTSNVGNDPFYKAIKRMKELNMTNYVIEQQSRKLNKLYSARLSLYKSFSQIDNIRLSEIHELDIDQPISLNSTYSNNGFLYFDHLPYSKRVTYEYNSAGRLTMNKAKCDLISYIWNTTNLYPIIKAHNISVDDLNSAYAATGNDASLIHSYLEPNTQIFTYTYLQLIGISSVSDQNRNKTFYTYDAFGRLKTIKDDQGKIIQSYEYHHKTSN